MKEPGSFQKLDARQVFPEQHQDQRCDSANCYPYEFCPFLFHELLLFHNRLLCYGSLYHIRAGLSPMFSRCGRYMRSPSPDTGKRWYMRSPSPILGNGGICTCRPRYWQQWYMRLPSPIQAAVQDTLSLKSEHSGT